MALLAVSCVLEPVLDPEIGMPGFGAATEEEAPTIGIGIKVPNKAGASASGEYQPGNYYENHIDIRKGDYRIYFFNENNVLINRFVPTIITPIYVSESYTSYNFHGKAPAGLVSGTTFKVVVIANWGSYDDSSMVPGTTTIDDLCNASWAQFSMNEHIFSFTMKMPFFGVREYENQVFAVSDDGRPITLPQPVDLLRGMARVEVVVDAANSDFNGMKLEEVYVDRYNSVGYCAPSGVTHQDDYVHNNWDLDYAESIHLVAGRRQEGPLNFRRTDDEEQETWMLYLLEYDHHNNQDASDFTTINLKFDKSDIIFPIYFAKYTDGRTSNLATERFDIKRNNLYRFRVTADLLVFPEFSVYVDPFDDGGEWPAPMF